MRILHKSPDLQAVDVRCLCVGVLFLYELTDMYVRGHDMRILHTSRDLWMCVAYVLVFVHLSLFPYELTDMYLRGDDMRILHKSRDLWMCVAYVLVFVHRI